MILGDESERKKSKTTDMWLEALKGAFKLMGGSSPYALTNLGAAGESLATGISGILNREEQSKQQRIGQLVALGLKGSELDTQLAKLGIDRAEYEAKLPLIKAQAKYWGEYKGKTGTGGSVSSAVTKQIYDEYLKGYKNSPKSAPFFKDLPLDVQTALLKTDPSSKSYQNAMEKSFMPRLKQELMQEMNFNRAYGIKQLAVPGSTDLP